MDARFGRCNYFVIYDTESDEYKSIGNSGVYSSQGAGIAAAQTIIDEKVDVLITGNIGPNAMKLLNASGTIIYQLNSGTVDEALKQFTENKLSEISKPVPAHFGMNDQHRRGR